MSLSTKRRRDRDRCRRARVWLNSVEVTNRCFYVDVRRQVVRLFSVKPDGSKFIDASGNKIATEEHRGHVVLKVARAV